VDKRPKLVHEGGGSIEISAEAGRVPYELAIDDTAVEVCRQRLLTQEVMDDRPLLRAEGVPPVCCKLKPTASSGRSS
jgi:hypothetical protein